MIHQSAQITLNDIKAILCPNGTKKAFVNHIFEPLKVKDMPTFSESYNVITSHLSEFMNGNQDRSGRRQSVSTLQVWADMLCPQSVYPKVLERVSAYADLNAEQAKQLYALFELDQPVMPPALITFIERAFRRRIYSEACLMLILWSVYGMDQMHLLAPIFRSTEPEQPAAESMLLPHRVAPKPVYIGKERLLNDVFEMLSQGSHFVFLQGMGGIGKSECAKQYAKQFEYYYDTVVFAECSSTLTALLNDNTVFTLTEPFLSERLQYEADRAESDEEFYRRKLVQLRKAVSQRTLLILDNVDRQDPALPDFLTGMCHVIITTRWQSQQLYPDETLFVDEPDDAELPMRIFSAYYNQDLANDAYAAKIIEYFSGHPLALELTAKQMLASCISAEEMWQIITEQKTESVPEGFSLHARTSERNLFEHICHIFRIAALSEPEQRIMTRLAMLPAAGIRKAVFRELCGLPDYTALNRLISRSWIRDINGTVSMHALIRETVQLTAPPDLTACRDFTDRLMQKYSALDCFYADYQEKTFIYNLAVHIYALFPEPTAEHGDLYEWIELNLSHYQQKTALELAQKLHNLYWRVYGEQHFRTIRMVCRIACAYKSSNRLEEGRTMLAAGRARLKKLPNKTPREMLYLSDVDLVLADLYRMTYIVEQDPALLDEIESLCEELIAIRTAHHGAFDPRMTTDIEAYYELAMCAVYRNDIPTAEDCLRRMTQKYQSGNAGYLIFRILSLRAELAVAQNKPEEAIGHLEEAIRSRAVYFGGGAGDASASLVEQRVKLCKLYEQSGRHEQAMPHYIALLGALEPLPYYRDESRWVRMRLNAEDTEP